MVRVFATVDWLDELLFAALARAVERLLGKFNSQDLANTVWAFATSSQCDALLLAALEKARVVQSVGWSARELGSERF